jgi:hypothetical protein
MRRSLVMAVLFAIGFAGASQARPASTTSAAWVVESASEVNGRVRIVLRNGHVVTVRRLYGECSFDSIQIAPDGVTVGWVVGGTYEVGDEKPCRPGAQYVANGPVIWRAGKIIHDFTETGGEINWSFYGGGGQIAFHVGPTHFDDAQACELHDIASGRLLKAWSKEDNTARPAWAAGLGLP